MGRKPGDIRRQYPSLKATLTERGYPYDGACGYLYVLGFPGGYYKIGITKDPATRFSQANVSLPIDLEIVHIVFVTDARGYEESLHKELRRYHVRGEWYKLPAHILDVIKSIESV